MSKYTHGSHWFYGNEVSDYGKEHGHVDYRTLAKAFDAVMANDIIPATSGIVGEWDIESGNDLRFYDGNDNEITREEYNELDAAGDTDIYYEYVEIFQYFIISARGAEILEELTDEIVFYNDKLDLYVWGVTHWGTSWDYVLTDIKIDLNKYKEN